MQINSETYQLTDVGQTLRVRLFIGVIGLTLSLVGYFADAAQFFHSYLTAYLFWLSIILGALFFIMLHYLTGATWSIVVRRIVEGMTATLPWMAILFIPVLLGMKDLFHWTDPQAMQDPVLQKKAAFLNVPFFVVRAVVYFVIWFVLSQTLLRKSLRQDGSSSVSGMTKISAPGMILFALTITFAAFDWMMSLEAHWYSTIYGVYLFCGAVMAMLALLAVIAAQLRQRNILKDVITVEHFHDIGKLMFAFMILWAYMAFSQYFLIWYANIPEETVWFHRRWVGSWKLVTLILVWGHFPVPFLALISRPAKRNPNYLAAVSLWLLAMHWLDLFWNVMPALHVETVRLSWMDATTTVGVGGMFLFFFWKRLAAHPIVPFNDPMFEASVMSVNR